MGNTQDVTQSVTVNAGQTALLDTNGNDVTLAGNITGGGGLAKKGAGTLTLGGGNSYAAAAGSTTVVEGTLLATSPDGLPGYDSSGDVVVDNGAAVGESIGGSDPWTPDNLTNLVNAATWPSSAGASLAIDTPDGQYSYSSAIANPTPDPAYPSGY